jgi:protoporphyrinogen oxidase
MWLVSPAAVPIDQTARVAIIGAGPCGLACARELEQLGHRNWQIFERAPQVGGLARSVIDPAGFTWDLGGHVVFSHYGEFDALLEEVMGADVRHHDRSSYVRAAERWVPYPFQNNLRHLPPAEMRECLDGLRDAAGATPDMNFADWMLGVFGAGITRHFMAPYNLKVWATAPERMGSRWIGERVAVIDYARAAAAVRSGQDELGWGPNSAFQFPATGGTGEIYRRLALPLADRIRLGVELTGLDPVAHQLRFSDRSTEAYDVLLSTMPLDQLVVAVDGVPGAVAAAGSELIHNGVFMVGVGLEQPLVDERSWMYFPDDEVPFYRVTNFAKYSDANVPGSDITRYSSYMTETAFSPTRPVSRDGLADAVVAGLRQVGLADAAAGVASVHTEEIPYAYPVPTLERDRALAVIQPWLEQHDILSRGRFGTWRYELGNMDHAVKMGVDAARRLVRGDREAAFSS